MIALLVQNGEQACNVWQKTRQEASVLEEGDEQAKVLGSVGAVLAEARQWEMARESDRDGTGDEWFF